MNTQFLLRMAFATEMENIALTATGDEVAIPNPDPHGSDIVFLTEYHRESCCGRSRLWCGPSITANDWDHADKIASVLGLRVTGKYDGVEHF